MCPEHVDRRCGSSKHALNIQKHSSGLNLWFELYTHIIFPHRRSEVNMDVINRSRGQHGVGGLMWGRSKPFDV